jgi:DNA polymerase-1
MYGRGSKAISEQYGISVEEAEEVRNLFFQKYPMASIWLDKQVAYAKEHGYVKTWMGRIRRLPEINAEDHMIRAEAERQAKNSPIQGLASDMNNHFMRMNLKLAKKKGLKVYPITTIHDANIYMVKKEHVKKMIKIMKYVVKNAFPEFRCEMKLDFELGDTLGTLKEVE